MSWQVFVSLGGIPIALTVICIAALILWKVRDKRIVAALLLLTFFVGWMALTVPIALKVTKQATYENPNQAESEAALARDPSDAAAHMSLAHILLRQGRYEELLPHLREVIRIEPDNVEAPLILAYELRKLGHNDEYVALLKSQAQRKDKWGARAQKRLEKYQALHPSS